MIEFRQNAPMSAPPAPARSCRQLAISRLADAICELRGSGEPVTEEALLARDFSPAIISHYATEARRIARHRFDKRS